jgi:RimJ/RimL family protein N-acetyltransferase
MKQPTLRTDRLQLQPASIHDLDALWAVWRDEDVRRVLFDGDVVTRERASRLLAAGLAAASYGLGLWLVRPHGRPDVMGCVGLLVHSAGTPARDPSRDLIEPLAAMLPVVWGCGYANEALAALRAHAQRIGRAHSLVGNGRVHHDQAAAAEGLSA